MPATATTPLLDASKRVHYTLGLVLGEDEFRQEQGYFIERDRLHNRALHGYGTVSGLAVEVVPAGDGDAEVRVRPGLAVDPFGESIAVDATQCARLAPWLSRSATRDRLDELEASPPDEVRVYLTLAYRERLTDDIPVPGAPCRDEDDSAVASRIDDAFELAFSLDRPPHVEEAAVRLFADFLGRITLVADDSADAGSALTEAEFLDAVRAYAEAAGPASPPESPPESPPGAPPVLVLASEADDLLRAGLRTWVTDLRPDLLGDAYANPREAGDDRVLIAELVVGIERDGDVVRVASADDAPDVTVVEDDRPYLLTTRLIQERLLARFDVRFEETLGIGDAAGGDLTGTYPSPTVRALQTRAVAEAAPANGNVLTWNEGAAQWEPAAPAVGGGGGGLTLREVAERLPTVPLVTVAPNTGDRDRGPGFFLWFHLDANADLRRDNVPAVEGLDDEAVAVFAETDRDTPAASPFLRRLDVGRSENGGLPRNTFFLPVREADQARQLRFKFDLERIAASVEGRPVRLAEWVSERPMKWEGHDGERTVTAFVTNDRPEARPAPEPPARTGPDIVAAGVFESDANRRIRPLGPVLGGLRAEAADDGFGEVLLRFPSFTPNDTYVVTGTPLVERDRSSASNTLQVVFPFEDRGIRLRFRSEQTEPQIRGFMVQVVQITG